MVAKRRAPIALFFLLASACSAPSVAPPPGVSAGGAGGSSATDTTSASSGGGGADGDDASFGSGGGPADAGGIVNDGNASSCLARSSACGSDAATDDALHAALDDAIAQCAKSAGESTPCGIADVRFDDLGCATSLTAALNDGPPSKVAACLVQKLDAERWPCAAGRKIHWYWSCTVL